MDDGFNEAFALLSEGELNAVSDILAGEIVDPKLIAQIAETASPAIFVRRDVYRPRFVAHLAELTPNASAGLVDWSARRWAMALAEGRSEPPDYIG